VAKQAKSELSKDSSFPSTFFYSEDLPKGKKQVSLMGFIPSCATENFLL
jgi:hypothetical protein